MDERRKEFHLHDLHAAQRAYRVYRHVLGTDPATDVLLYEESDETFALWLLKSRSDAYIQQLFCRSTVTNEWHILPNTVRLA